MITDSIIYKTSKCQIAKKANYYQKTHGRSIDNKDAQANAKDLPEQFQKQ